MKIETFSHEQMAGQRLMVGFDGTGFDEDLKFLIDTMKVGGIILFKRNLSDPAQIKTLCLSVQEYAASCGQPPLLISIDQEGGQVARLRKPFFTEFPGNPRMRDKADAIRFAEITAAELKDMGINMNMAPVMDIAPNETSIMAQRSFGSDPEWVSELGITVIEHLQRNGVMAVAKHFPGIGRTILDSHFELPVCKLEMADLNEFDLLPFEAANRHGVAAMMLSHILYDKLDPDWPASLSVRIAKNLLRDRMGFDGVVITDDLDMGAIKKHYDIQTVVRQILSAEIDITLICHKGPDIESAFEEILNALRDSEKVRTQTGESLRRILALKKNCHSSA